MTSTKPKVTPPTHAEIAHCAYLLWEKEGRPHGRHIVHWMQAEKQLLADYAQDSGFLDPAAAPQLDLKKFRRLIRAANTHPKQARVQ